MGAELDFSIQGRSSIPPERLPRATLLQLSAGERDRATGSGRFARPAAREKIVERRAFSVDGTMRKACAAMQSFRAKDGWHGPPAPGRGGARVVRIFPNDASCLGLIRALAVDQHEAWHEDNRYIDMSLAQGDQAGAVKSGGLRLARARPEGLAATPSPPSLLARSGARAMVAPGDGFTGPLRRFCRT